MYGNKCSEEGSKSKVFKVLRVFKVFKETKVHNKRRKESEILKSISVVTAIDLTNASFKSVKAGALSQPIGCSGGMQK